MPTPSLRPLPQRWLLLFNCQAPGLANCFSLLSRDVEVESHDTVTLGPNRDALLARLDGFDRVLVAPGVEKLFALDLGERDNVWRLPPVVFAGFHPDACILAQEGDLSQGPLGLYHSALAYAAFRHGLDAGQAVALFAEPAYRALGYLDRWPAERDALLAAYRAAGFELAPAFVRWSRHGVFMHTTNRPKIACLLDVARLVLARAGLPAFESEHLPVDNLASGPAWPVYPEIAARLGLRGSRLFREEARCAQLGLEPFVAACFEVYRGCSDIEVTRPAFRPMLERAMAYVESLR